MLGGLTRGGITDGLDVYVLGAGASAVHGAPVTDGILSYAFEHAKPHAAQRLEPVRDLLADVFDCDPADPPPHGYPGLADVLSMVDMAIDRHDHLAAGYDADRLHAARDGIEYAIFSALDESLRDSDRSSTATRRLAAGLLAGESAVISLNYDVIIDRAIAHRDRPISDRGVVMGNVDERRAGTIDYGVEFANVGVQQQERVPLLKLHGSFNWFESKVTGDLYYGGMSKEVEALYTDRDSVWVPNLAGEPHARLPLPRDQLRALMITPTHLKDMRDPNVVAIWRKAASVVRSARRLTFVGYSLPGDDIHVKYLFKQAIATRPSGPPPDIVVVNPDLAAVANYGRFFGRVTEHHADFEEFAAGLSGRAA